MAESTVELILNYIEQHTTLVLATVGSDGVWATPVFYVNRGFKLYFLSEAKTKHSRNLQLDEMIAAAITEDRQEWQTIQGLQIQGRAYLVTSAAEKALALAAYLRKFPAVRHIFEAPSQFKGVIAARWHCIEPEILRLTDNSKGFGSRFELNLKKGENPSQSE